MSEDERGTLESLIRRKKLSFGEAQFLRDMWAGWSEAQASKKVIKGLIAEREKVWIAIADRTPDFETYDDSPCEINGVKILPMWTSADVLVVVDGRVTRDHCVCVEGSRPFFYLHGDLVTHWMQFPSPP